MTKKHFDINKLRVAAPCSAPWESMTGDARVRHCDSCKLNVYNTEEMTKREVENLIATRAGRLCIRLYKRADGTVLTKDCPVGRRAYHKRVARFAGAALTAILGLFSISYGQSEREEKNVVDASQIKAVKISALDEKGSLAGKVTDPAGAVVPKAELRLVRDGTGKKIAIRADENGEFNFSGLSEGTYTLEARYKGFAVGRIENVTIKSGSATMVEIMLYPQSKTVTVGIFVDEESMIDTTSSEVKKTITRKMLDLIP